MISLTRIPQDLFVDRYWQARPGEHVALIGPTDCGKTTLGMRLLPPMLDQNPDTRACVLAMKPHRRGALWKRRTGDTTVTNLAREQGARIIRSWPPPERVWPRQRYFVLWPKHRFDPAVDDPAHYTVFRRAILDAYKQGDWWLFADEAYSLTHELGLRDELVTLWTKARSMDTAIIAATQKPSHVPTWMYSQSSHLFLWYDSDHRARQRYAEISGFDPRTIHAVVSKLTGRDCLYVRPRDRTLCIVSAT